MPGLRPPPTPGLSPGRTGASPRTGAVERPPRAAGRKPLALAEEAGASQTWQGWCQPAWCQHPLPISEPAHQRRSECSVKQNGANQMRGGQLNP